MHALPARLRNEALLREVNDVRQTATNERLLAEADGSRKTRNGTTKPKVRVKDNLHNRTIKAVRREVAGGETGIDERDVLQAGGHPPSLARPRARSVDHGSIPRISDTTRRTGRGSQSRSKVNWIDTTPVGQVPPSSR